MNQDRDFDRPQREVDFDPRDRQSYGEGPVDSDQRQEYGRQGDYGADQPGGESFGQRQDYASQQDDYATDQLDSESEEHPGYQGRQQDYAQESGSVRGDADYDSGNVGGQAGESEPF